MAKKTTSPQKMGLKANAAGAAYNERVKRGLLHADHRSLPRYRALKAPDHSSPGEFSWCVFDSHTTDRKGNFTYIADCINAKDARRVADALNAFTRLRRRVLTEAAAVRRDLRKTVDDSVVYFEDRAGRTPARPSADEAPQVN